MSNNILDRYYTKHAGGNWTEDQVFKYTVVLCSYMTGEQVRDRMNDIWWLMQSLSLNFDAAADVCLDQAPGFTQTLDPKSFRSGWHLAGVRVSKRGFNWEKYWAKELL
jgi:hypothetical protein